MADQYVALKEFGGGLELRSKYGRRGPARMIARGTVINGKDMTQSLTKDLEGKGLITPYKKGERYETQSDRDSRIKSHDKANSKKPEAKDKKSEDKKAESKDKAEDKKK